MSIDCVCMITEDEYIDACRIHIYKGKKKVLSLDPVMENYNEIKKYRYIKYSKCRYGVP